MRLTLLAGAALLALGTRCAHADAIDGAWCLGEGQRMTIAGPVIVTPGGHRMEGSYARHSFSYVAPPGEADAGQPIAMLLIDENTVRLTTSTTTQTWHRCGPSVSGLWRWAG